MLNDGKPAYAVVTYLNTYTSGVNRHSVLNMPPRNSLMQYDTVFCVMLNALKLKNSRS